MFDIILAIRIHQQITGSLGHCLSMRPPGLPQHALGFLAPSSARTRPGGAQPVAQLVESQGGLSWCRSWKQLMMLRDDRDQCTRPTNLCHNGDVQPWFPVKKVAVEVRPGSSLSSASCDGFVGLKLVTVWSNG